MNVFPKLTVVTLFIKWHFYASLWLLFSVQPTILHILTVRYRYTSNLTLSYRWWFHSQGITFKIDRVVSNFIVKVAKLNAFLTKNMRIKPSLKCKRRFSFIFSRKRTKLSSKFQNFSEPDEFIWFSVIFLYEIIRWISGRCFYAETKWEIPIYLVNGMKEER